MSYNVVVEFNTTQIGSYGYRIWQTYIDRIAFEESNLPYFLTVIDKGITDEKAMFLICQTPEICMLTNLVERMFQESDYPNPVSLKIALGDVHSNILFHRHIWTMQGVPPLPNAERYIKLISMAVQTPSSKNNILKILLRGVTNASGQVDLGRLNTLIDLSASGLFINQRFGGS